MSVLGQSFSHGQTKLLCPRSRPAAAWQNQTLVWAWGDSAPDAGPRDFLAVSGCLLTTCSPRLAVGRGHERRWWLAGGFPWEGVTWGLPCSHGSSHTASRATASRAGPQPMGRSWRKTGRVDNRGQKLPREETHLGMCSCTDGGSQVHPTGACGGDSPSFPP